MEWFSGITCWGTWGGVWESVCSRQRHHQELYSWPQNPHTRTSRSWSVRKISKPHPYHSLRAHSIKWDKDPLAIKLAISEQLGYATLGRDIATLATPVDLDSSLSLIRVSLHGYGWRCITEDPPKACAIPSRSFQSNF